jgi:hypothetical protein
MIPERLCHAKSGPSGRPVVQGNLNHGLTCKNEVYNKKQSSYEEPTMPQTFLSPFILRQNLLRFLGGIYSVVLSRA